MREWRNYCISAPRWIKGCTETRAFKDRGAVSHPARLKLSNHHSGKLVYKNFDKLIISLVSNLIAIVQAAAAPSTNQATNMLANIVLCYSALLVASISTQVNSLKPAASVDSTSANGNARDCLQRANQLDRCLPKLVFYGDRDFDPPRSEQKLDEHCRMLDENVKCVSSYSRECLPSFARNLYSVVLRRLKTQFAKRCKTKDGRRDFINLMACADVQHTEPTHKCMDSFVAQLEHIGSGAQSRQIELICCTFQVFQDCIFAASKRIKCAQRVVTADKSIEYVRGIINSMGGDMMDFMCGKYDKLSACLSGYPAIMAQFKEIANKVHNGTLRPVSKSPIKPMLQLFIDSQEGGEL